MHADANHGIHYSVGVGAGWLSFGIQLQPVFFQNDRLIAPGMEKQDASGANQGNVAKAIHSEFQWVEVVAQDPSFYCSQVNRRSLLNEVKELALLLTRSFAALRYNTYL